MWVIPIVMLNERFALLQVTPEKQARTTLSFTGICVAIIAALALIRKIRKMAAQMQRGPLRGLITVTWKVIVYLLVLVPCIFINRISDQLLDWWRLCGISYAMGLTFTMVDEAKGAKKNET